MNVQYRNGTKIRYKQNTTNSVNVWVQDTGNTAPANLYYFVSETLSYQCNKTIVAAPNWRLDAAKTWTLYGYEIYTNAAKSTTRYITTDINKKWCWTDDTAATAAASDQSDFNYKKLISMTYNRTDKTSAGAITVYFRNGTIANFNNNAITQKNFVNYKTAPESYFSYYTINSYSDGTQE